MGTDKQLTKNLCFLVKKGLTIILRKFRVRKKKAMIMTKGQGRGLHKDNQTSMKTSAHLANNKQQHIIIHLKIKILRILN